MTSHKSETKETERSKKEQRRANGLPEKMTKETVPTEASGSAKASIVLPNKTVETIPFENDEDQLIASKIVKVHIFYYFLPIAPSIGFLRYSL